MTKSEFAHICFLDFHCGLHCVFICPGPLWHGQTCCSLSYRSEAFCAGKTSTLTQTLRLGSELTRGQWALVAETFYNVSIMVTKISILALFNRIFPYQWFKRTILGLGCFIVAYSIPQIFGTIFQCVPVHARWTPGTPATCIHYVGMIIACGVINIVTDFIMLGLPIPALWSLQVSSHRKWALTFMFLIGGMYVESFPITAPNTYSRVVSA